MQTRLPFTLQVQPLLEDEEEPPEEDVVEVVQIIPVSQLLPVPLASQQRALLLIQTAVLPGVLQPAMHPVGHTRVLLIQ